MNRSRPGRQAASCVIMIMGLLCWSAEARAQSNVGAGPLTSTLTDVEPTTGVLRLGPVVFAPGVTVREIGWDSNVFDEPDEDSPKEDWVASVQPDISGFTRLRFVRLSGYAGADLTYYRTNESERSIGHSARGRVDFLLSRIRPFIGGGVTETRTRPNGEIDTRADRHDEEVSFGLAFDLSATSLVYGSAYRARNEFENALEDGVDLGQALTREANNYQVGLKTDLTPLLSMQLYGGFQEDLFDELPSRNSESRMATAIFRFAPEAVVTGVVQLGYRDQTFVDPSLKPYKGMVGLAGITYPFLEIGHFSFAFNRGIEYSFDVADAYFLEQTWTLGYTHRLFGEVDAGVRGSRSSFTYDARETQPARTDTLDTVGASLGYNLRNRTRVALNYEIARRRSPEFADRTYERRRVYLSWLFAF